MLGTPDCRRRPSCYWSNGALRNAENEMQSRSQRIGMTIAGVMLIVGIIIATIGVLQIREDSGSPHVVSAATVTATAGAMATATSVPLPAGNDWTQYRF